MKPYAPNVALQGVLIVKYSFKYSAVPQGKKSAALSTRAVSRRFLNYVVGTRMTMWSLLPVRSSGSFVIDEISIV